MKERDDLDFLRRENQFKKLALAIGSFTIITLVGAFYFYLQDARSKTELQRANAALEVSKLELAAQLDTLEKVKQLLEESKSQTDAIRDSLTEALTALQKRVSLPQASTISKNVDRILSKSANSKFRVQLVSFGVDDRTLTRLHRWMENEGYVIGEIEPLDKKESWLAETSTVFYYSPASEAAATELAKKMRSELKIRVQLEPGKNARIVKGYDSSLIAVHLIR
ncbi:MAG: hypothetical protein OEM26_09895 [Saprospiraceae bacterium]|nr:hypothetical protein [Saprospiraceae bacterium]